MYFLCAFVCTCDGLLSMISQCTTPYNSPSVCGGASAKLGECSCPRAFVRVYYMFQWICAHNYYKLIITMCVCLCVSARISTSTNCIIVKELICAGCAAHVNNARAFSKRQRCTRVFSGSKLRNYFGRYVCVCVHVVFGSRAV